MNDSPKKPDQRRGWLRLIAFFISSRLAQKMNAAGRRKKAIRRRQPRRCSGFLGELFMGRLQMIAAQKAA